MQKVQKGKSAEGRKWDMSRLQHKQRNMKYTHAMNQNSEQKSVSPEPYYDVAELPTQIGLFFSNKTMK